MEERQTFRLLSIPKVTQELLDFAVQSLARQIQTVSTLASSQRVDMGASLRRVSFGKAT